MNGPTLGAAPGETPPPRGISSERRAAVNHAREAWIRRLIDLSRRNNLLYFRDLKTGTLDLSDSNREGWIALLRGESVALDRLLPEGDDPHITARAQEIRRRALANLEEKGLETLFLALGMATWPAVDEGRPAECAVLLAPVTIERRGREGRELALRRRGEVQANPVLLHVLEIEHGLLVSVESLLEAAGNEEEEQLLRPEGAFEYLSAAASKVRGFTITPRMILGNFSFQKMAMVKDLREQAEGLVRHNLVAAIAGYGPAREAVRGAQTEIDPRDLDRRPPEQEFLILDADSSQQRVIAAVLAGQDGVIQGPPGTGKSQTITNLVAELAAQGRRVLFVAEKRAALEVVVRRLEEKGLEHLLLDLHGADISRRKIMECLAESLDLVRETPPVDTEDLHRQFMERRQRLNEHVRRLHTPRAPAGTSVYALQGRLLRLPSQAVASTRWRGADFNRLDSPAASLVRDLFVEAKGFSGLLLRTDPSPWTGAVLSDGATVQQALDLVARLAHERWPAVRECLADLSGTTGVQQPSTPDEAGELLRLFREVATTVALYQPEIFQEDLEGRMVALRRATRGRAALPWAWCFDGEFRRTRHALRARRRDKRVRTKQLLSEVRAAADQLRRWRALATTPTLPCLAPGLEEARRRYIQFRTDLDALGPLLNRQDLSQLRLDLLGKLLDDLSEDRVTPYRIPRLLAIERELAQRGVQSLIAELRSRKPDPSLWPDIFEHAWLSSCLDRARAEDPALAGFHGRTHDRFVEDFCRLDRDRLELTIRRVRRTHAERAVSVMNTHPDQAAVVRREAAKKTRHLPFRRLVAEAPDVLTALRPCWIASPLSVSQLLPADRCYFDIVLFDEASQVLPEDAVPALLRSARAVVAGDQHQLPPTPFFVAGEDEQLQEEGPLPSEGFESILDLLSAFLDPWHLNWHYRSRDEALIAFSNRHIYRDRLVTFPGCGRGLVLSHVLVPQLLGADGEEESASQEVARVVELVLEHATQRPDESLGVIAMGLPHARRVEAALDRALRSRPELAAYFDEARHERFFVKNIERVQGDEREAIILTIGYGKDRSGRLPHRFGPLLYEGGERRLNVAITRARSRMTLVSSFNHHEIDPKRSPSRGVELLRMYVGYASSGGRVLGDVGPTTVPLNPFEQDVYDTLTVQGLPLLPQWGASQYRIDLVAQHPRRPGRFVLAIECDGAYYHSTPTARDRDRLRQQHLEALGWRFHRIWSTDWFMRKDEEVTRALRTFEAAVVQADRVDSREGGSSPVSPTDPEPPPREGSGGDPFQAPRKGSRPGVNPGRAITEYTLRELTALIRWIQSDGRLLTDEELIQEAAKELGFTRRGARIEASIRRAIDVVRSAPRKV